MEIRDSNTYHQLFCEDVRSNLNLLFPLARKCFVFSSNEAEIMRALQISFEFAFQVYSIDQLEKEIISSAAPAARKIFHNNLQTLENLNQKARDSVAESTCSRLLETCTQILSYFTQFLDQLNNFDHLVTVSQFQHFLLNCVEIVHESFSHCSISEQLYGPLFDSLTNSLTSCFRKTCELTDTLLSFLSLKMNPCFEDTEDVTVLCQLLTWLSKSATVLMTLDVKMMAKVWKAHVALVEKHVHHIKDQLNISDIIASLATAVSTDTESALAKGLNDHDFSRKIKLACFNLKLIIKFYDVFGGCIKSCQKLILNLLVILCRCGLMEFECQDLGKTNEKLELVKQLSYGADPLLAHVMREEEMTREFAATCLSLTSEKSASFAMVCCLVLKKLMRLNGIVRRNWLCEKWNILCCLFQTVSTDEYGMCLEKRGLHDIIVRGKQRKMYDLYQHVLITMSSFIMTVTSEEFPLVEKVLLRNVLQPKPLPALLAIDVWCLLARYSDSDLCLTQILKLHSMLTEFDFETFRVEKCHLMSLIQRLYPLLTQRQRNLLTKSLLNFFPSSESGKSFGLQQEEGSEFNVYLTYDVNSSFWRQVQKSICKTVATENKFDSGSSFYGSGNKQTVQTEIVKFWRFDPARLLNYRQNEKFLKITCSLTARSLPFLSSENTLMVLTRMKNLLTVIGESSSVRLYLTRILAVLSGITFPPDSFQRDILNTTADIFRSLLRSERTLPRERALDVFYHFSHVTPHPEIVTLSVNNSPSLKCDVTNYFKKVPTPAPPDFKMDAFMGSLCASSFRQVCVCEFVAVDGAWGSGGKTFINNKNHELAADMKVGSNGENVTDCPTDIDHRETVNSFVKSVETLIRIRDALTYVQKVEITNMCNCLLNSMR